MAICQASPDSGGLHAALVERGFEPLLLPQIRFEARQPEEPLDLPFDLLLLTSPRALSFLLEIVPYPELLEVGEVLAVGPRTAKEALAAGLPVNMEAEAGTGAALVEMVAPAPPVLEVLLPRGNLAGDRLVNGLERLGHRVTAPVVYSTEQVVYSEEQVVKLRRDPPEVLLFTSPSTFRNFVDTFGQEPVRAATVGVIGPTTRAAVERAGFEVRVEPGRPDVVELADRLRRHLAS